MPLESVKFDLSVFNEIEKFRIKNLMTRDEMYKKIGISKNTLTKAKKNGRISIRSLKKIKYMLNLKKELL